MTLKNFRRILFAAGLLATACTRSSSGPYVFQDHLSLKDFSPASATAQDEHSVTLEKNGARLRLRALRPDNVVTARILINTHIDEIFDPPPAPYPGYISNKVVCDQAFRPQLVSLQIDKLFFGGKRFFANSRFTPGECSADNAKMLYFRGIVSCATEGPFFDLEYFIPFTSSAAKPASDAPLAELLKNVACQ